MICSFQILPFCLIKVPVFRNLHFFNLVPFLLKNFSLDATLKSVGDVNNVFAFRKKSVLVVRIIGGGGVGLKISAKFST
jgi:hypothetical protein